jgi:CheY-like chemotaxis protein
MSIGLLRGDLPEDHRHPVEDVEKLLDECVAACRMLTVQLSPPVLHDRGLIAALGWLSRWMHETHKLAVEVEAVPEAEPQAADIRVLLFDIVRELLFNVVKHSQSDRAAVRLKRIDDQWVELTVEDQGIGFDPAGIANGQAEGFGFGLTSIRHRLELLGGTLEVQSSPSRGTRMIVRAPLGRGATEADTSPSATLADDALLPASAAEPRPGHRARRPAVAAVASRKPKRDLRILLVDDHKIVREGMAELLSRFDGIEVVGEAGDGVEAVEQARTLVPDAIVMDINMPRMNGIEATRQIKQEMPKVRVIGLSLHDQADMADALLAAGASAYVTKGGPSDHLVAAIRTTCNEPPGD